MKNLLVIDDDPMILDIVKPFFEYKGYTVSTAPNGFEGLQKFKDAKFDLVITDLMMEPMHGFQVIDKIRESDQGADIPIILLSADKDEPDLKLYKRSHFQTDTLAKPFDVPVLERIVKTLLVE